MTARLSIVSAGGYRPLVCVWEVTRACNSRCLHCGSSAGRPREQELSTAEAEGAIGELAALGCRTLALSGGEPLLRPDWPRLVATIRGRGMRAELMSNGLLVTEQLDAVLDAGFVSVSLSVDGPAAVHDELRGSGNLERVLEAASSLAAAISLTWTTSMRCSWTTDFKAG